MPKLLAFLGYDPDETGGKRRQDDGISCLRRTRSKRPREPDDLVKRLVAFRKSYGVSHETLAGLLGVDKRLVTGWECGLRGPSYPRRKLIEVILKNPHLYLSAESRAVPGATGETTSFQVY